ncbi:MAG: outer membrane beta-barrel protein [Deltaproteobacteria bacterium]|nr:outer membrane beta-barrel protein [Deltaproteobacteria bacterium]
MLIMVLAGVLLTGLYQDQTWAAEPDPPAGRSEVGETEKAQELLEWQQQVREEEEQRREEAAPAARPEFFPVIEPVRPSENLQVGPATGTLAPYGYAWAEDTLSRGWTFHRLGPFRVSPFLAYNGIYRSNIYQTSTDKKSDYVNNLRPGLSLELPLAHRHRLSLGYLGDYFIYSSHSTDSHYDHNVNADANFNFRGGLSLGFGSAYRHATEERSAVVGRKRRYDRTTPYFKAAYAFADVWKLETNYQFDNLDFAKAIDRQDDYQYHTGGATLFYKFWPKTAALVQYIIQGRVYPNRSINDSLSHSPLIGLTWDPTAKLSGTVKFGYTFREYDTDLAGRNNSPNSWALAMQTLYRYSRYTNLALTAQRSYQDDVDFGNNAYENSAVYVTLNKHWHYFRTDSYLAFYYINNNYVNVAADPVTGRLKERDDDIISVGCGLSRPFTSYFRLRLDYNFINKDSNFSTYSFNEHRLLFGIETSL